MKLNSIDKGKWSRFIEEKLKENNFAFLLFLSDGFKSYLENMSIELIEEESNFGEVIWIYTLCHLERLNFRLEKKSPEKINSTGRLSSIITKDELEITRDLFKEFINQQTENTIIV
jgi:hypothetical protein